MAKNNRSELEWAPKVSLAKIRALYLMDARGLQDEDLIDEVGMSLYWRCQSILEYTLAHTGWVQCKRCANSGITTQIERKTRKPSELLKCAVCDWQVRWRVYVAEAEKSGGNLHAGNAGAAFQKFVRVYPQCRTGHEKILTIDQLIHEFHWVLVAQDQARQPFKPAGVNLLQGSTSQVKETLFQLTYGENASAELLANREWWLAQKPVAQWAETSPHKKKEGV